MNRYARTEESGSFEGVFLAKVRRDQQGLIGADRRQLAARADLLESLAKRCGNIAMAVI
jgi:hypothetical protein